MESFSLKKEFPRVDVNGLRMNDQLVITPAYGLRKKINLNRTKLVFKACSDVSGVKKSNWEIFLPVMTKYCAELSLTLIPMQKTSDPHDTGRFLLKTLNGIPFKLNGQAVFECFPERGDVIVFGYHQLKFQVPQTEEVVEDFPFENRVCESNISIMIEGETGTGKTRLAGTIHERSHRSGRFVHLNLSSFSSGLVESELFGHIKGAFTGATGDKGGALNEADRGTLFLDEIDSISKDLQVKLLLFLDNGQYRPVGGHGVKKSNARIIFASGRNLEDLVESGEMRRDFFFRLKSGVNLRLKPLREDKEKIVSLCKFFANSKNVFVSNELIESYQELNWPGNARQLLGHLEKKRVLSGGDKIIWDGNDDSLKIDNEEIFLPDNVIPMKNLKINYANKILNQFDGSIKRTSDVLQISQNTLRSLVGK
ncbi:MAG: sigma-54-dependent Fis family transcriptional regulator [Bacteriovoracaceae bacterium]|nr:sigma-54-dependent Fis family transcriptional regulator [Bacteriovoracaceae bacterium]